MPWLSGHLLAQRAGSRRENVVSLALEEVCGLIGAHEQLLTAAGAAGSQRGAPSGMGRASFPREGVEVFQRCRVPSHAFPTLFQGSSFEHSVQCEADPYLRCRSLQRGWHARPTLQGTAGGRFYPVLHKPRARSVTPVQEPNSGDKETLFPPQEPRGLSTPRAVLNFDPVLC